MFRQALFFICCFTEYIFIGFPKPNQGFLGSSDGMQEALELGWGWGRISVFTIVRLKFSMSLSYEYRQQIELSLDALFGA